MGAIPGSATPGVSAQARALSDPLGHRRELCHEAALCHEVLEVMVAMFASGDPSAAVAVIAEDYLDHQGLGAGPVRGVEGFAHVVRTNHAAYEHQQVSIEDVFGVCDRAAARISWRGRRHDGECVDRETIDIVRVAEGRAVEHWGARA
ncbi:MAG: ester cyclase [Actinomycetota bacterium]|nr:ester cyclase [Actinomycetota bacterium]